MELLSKKLLNLIAPDNITVPKGSELDLPEKVLQFGTGRLLRGLIDDFIDLSNKRQHFNGRVVVVKSTDHGGTDEFDQQDNLYTLCQRGVSDGKSISTNTINASISRVVKANSQWREILNCAHNPEMQIIISNTTEAGIVLENEDKISDNPPHSFPGKILAFLYERFKAFGGSDESGMVIIPTELVPDNGKVLKSIVLELAQLNHLENKFIDWIQNHNSFCSSLVDRIVTGRPKREIKDAIEKDLGYKDDLMIVSEPYALWAIEGGQRAKELLSFAKDSDRIFIEENIDKYRELKLRLLNATHTFSCGVAFLYGCTTVKEAMNDATFQAFISTLMEREIAPSIPMTIDAKTKKQFASDVRDRFSNPALNHLWINITLEYTSKMHIRCLPLLDNYIKKNVSLPNLMTLSIAAYIFFTRPVENNDGAYYGVLDGRSYLINDAKAPWFYEVWRERDESILIQNVLSNTNFWGEDLTKIDGLKKRVSECFDGIKEKGMLQMLKENLA